VERDLRRLVSLGSGARHRLAHGFDTPAWSELVPRMQTALVCVRPFADQNGERWQRTCWQLDTRTGRVLGPGRSLKAYLDGLERQMEKSRNDSRTAIAALHRR